jgi:hypothetical protein
VGSISREGCKDQKENKTITHFTQFIYLARLAFSLGVLCVEKEINFTQRPLS